MARRRVAIPERATLRGRRWRVYIEKTEDMRGLRGLADLDEKTIHIDPRVDRQEREVTYVHELLHAIWPPGVVDEETEEKLVRGLEYHLHRAVAQGYLGPEEKK
jgi:hypothetical protein